MAIRLYPRGCSTGQLEKLAGVPEGTWARLEAHEATEPHEDPRVECKPGSATDAWYAKLYSNKDMADLHSFKVFGWGRLTAKALAYVRTLGNENAGGTRDPEHINALMEAQGVVAENINELHWG